MSLRYVLVDFMHIVHRCVAMEPLSVSVNVNGKPKIVDTTVPTYAIKEVWKYGGKGLFDTGVFLEGGSAYRKRHFADPSSPFNREAAAVGKAGPCAEGYKGTRTSGGALYTGADVATRLMNGGGVQCYRMDGFEADDSIFTVIQAIKAADPRTPIDVITNDSDLLPLVDDQVSVFMRGTREFAENGVPARHLYFQVTPRSWTDFVSYASAFKGFDLPYNSILLFKLMRGDSADNVPASTKGYGKKAFSQLVAQMREDGVPFDKVFRYGLNFDQDIAPFLTPYFPPETLEKMRYVYQGIGLRLITNDPTKVCLPHPIQRESLQRQISPLLIHLP